MLYCMSRLNLTIQLLKHRLYNANTSPFPLNQKQCLSRAGSFLYSMNNIDQGRVGWGVTESQFCSMGILWVRNCQTLFKHLFVQKCRYKNTTLLSVFSASWRDCCSFRHMRNLVVLAILLTLKALRVISIKFLLVISKLCKTEWSWELRTWSQHKINLLDILSTSPHYFCRK